MRKRTLGLSALLLAGTVSLIQAQNFSTAPCPDHNGGSDSWFGQGSRVCELRRTTMPLSEGRLGVEGNNGAIEVVGEDRADVALEAQVTAQASSKSEAEALLHEVRITTVSNDIRAEGPTAQGGLFAHRSWSVSYKLRVPRRVAHAELRTSNGGIRVSDLMGQLNARSSNGGIDVAHVRGDLDASTTNGGLHLEDVGGAVHAVTTNGGVHISLGGDQWQGSGLFAKSTNGGVTVRASDRFRAHLVADTTNGGISVGFPLTTQGKLGHHVDTDLNGGGAPVHLETTNGGISIDHL